MSDDFTMGWEEKLGIGTTSPVTTRLGSFAANQFTLNQQLIRPQGGDGNLDPLFNRVRLGVPTLQGQIRTEPTLSELTVLLPWSYGATPTGTDYPLGSTFVGHYVSMDKRHKVFDYVGVKVSSVVFECLPNAPMTATFNCLGLTETVNNAGTFPALSADASTYYPILTDGVFSVNGNAVCSELLRLTIDNVAVYRPFTNCTRGPTGIMSTERIITIEFLPGYDSDHAGLYPPSPTGWPVVVTFTIDALSLTWSMGKVIFEKQSPFANSAQEMMKLPMRGRALRQTSTPALVTTLVAA